MKRSKYVLVSVFLMLMTAGLSPTASASSSASALQTEQSQARERGGEARNDRATEARNERGTDIKNERDNARNERHNEAARIAEPRQEPRNEARQEPRNEARQEPRNEARQERIAEPRQEPRHELRHEAGGGVKYYGNEVETYALRVPKQVRFCGENIALQRMDLRERFDRELMAMNYMHSATLQIVKRANRYFPVIEPILRAHNIPDDMKYLCCIESALNPKSVSGTGAAGLWQFMPATAKEYGLQVNSEVDERYHIEKSTIAACAYLKDAYEIYQDWALVAASYNAGKRRISTELERQQCDNYFDLYLNEETSRYVYRILACKWVMEHLCDYGFRLKAEDLYQPIEYKKVTVNVAVEDWAAFAKQHYISYKQLKEANLWIKGYVLTNASGRLYEIKIPAHDKALYFDEKHLKIHQPSWIYEGE